MPRNRSIVDTSEVGRTVHLAATTANKVGQERLQKRLSQNRVPSTQSQSDTWVDWGQMQSLLGQPFDARRVPISKLEQMRRDPMLAFGLYFVKIPLIRAKWHIQSTDPQRAAFIENALRRIWGRFVLAYGNCFDYGYSGLVKRFEYESPDWTYIDPADPQGQEKQVWPDKNVQALVWKPFMALSPRYASPHWNAAGEFAGIDINKTRGGFNFTDNNGKPADIPLDWALWATNEKDSVYGSLWGYPRLGYAYRYWWSYWYKFANADRAFERWADPPIYVYFPSNQGADGEGELVDNGAIALGVAEQFRSGANIAIPSDVVTSHLEDRIGAQRQWEVGQIEAKVNFDALNQQFEYLDVLKLRSMMVPEQAVMEGLGGSSSRNVAATFGDLFQESQAAVMQEIDDLVNRYMIPQLLEANFGPGGASCTKVTTGFDPQDVETMRAIIGGFANTQPEKLPIDLRKTLQDLGIPLMSHEAYLKVLDDAAKEAEQQQQAGIEAAKAAAGISGPTGPSGGKPKGTDNAGL